MQEQLKKKVDMFVREIRQKQREEKKQQIRASVLVDYMANTLIEICGTIKDAIKKEIVEQLPTLSQTNINQSISNVESCNYSLSTELKALKDQIMGISEKLLQFDHNFEKIQTNFVKQEENDTIISKIQLLGTRFEAMEEKIKDLEKSILCGRISEKDKLPSAIQREQSIRNTDWIDPSCFYYGQLAISGTLVECMINNIIIFGKKLVSESKQFAVKIDALMSSIAIGIADRQYRGKTSLQTEPNLVVYWRNGGCWNGRGWKPLAGKPYGQASKITVKVDIQRGVVEWLDGEALLHREICFLNTSPKIYWVPIIFSAERGDVIRILS